MTEPAAPIEPRPRTLADWLVLALGTGLFLGLLSPRNATVGTLLGIPLAYALRTWFEGIGYLLALIVLWGVGAPICERSAKILGASDPRQVTYDEIATLPLVYFLAPQWSLSIVVVGFLLHRLFDATKIFGVGRVERLPGGVGIMADDVVASLYAFLVLQLLLGVGVIH